jgi:hypothetical protein
MMALTRLKALFLSTPVNHGMGTMMKIEFFHKIPGYVLLAIVFSIASAMLMSEKASSPMLLSAFIMVAFVVMTDPWLRMDEWKLHLPISTRDQLIGQLISASLRIGITAVLCASFVSLQSNNSQPVLFALLASEFFFALSFLLLMRLPSPTQPMWPYAAVLIPLAIVFATAIARAGLPVWVTPAMAVAIFAMLANIAFSKLPVSFLLCKDQPHATPKSAPQAPDAAVAPSSRWRSLLRINAVTPNVLLFVPFTCLFAFVDLGFSTVMSPMLLTAFAVAPKDTAHLPVSLRLRFAFLLIPALFAALIGSLGPHFMKKSPHVFYPDYNSSSYRFGQANTTDDYARITEAHLWPLAASIITCPGSSPSEVKDMRYLRAGLYRCYGFDPSIDLAPYMKHGRVEWESFWNDHPSTPKDLNYRFGLAAYRLIVLFLSAFAVLGARIAVRSGSRLVQTICRYPNWAVLAPVYLLYFIQLIWRFIGELHAEEASNGAMRLESAFVGAIAESLPISPATALLALVVLAAPLYIAAQEMFTRCDQA